MSSSKILNIAHRGARSLAPENTLTAAHKGFVIGADMWELDVSMTADGEMVIIHDDTCERTSNIADVFPTRCKAKIHEFTLEELRRVDFGSWYIRTDPFKQISAGVVSADEQKSYKDLTIPTLKEALSFTRENDWRVNVEIKSLSGTPNDLVVVEKVVALIKELHMTSHVIISSFNHAYLQRARKASTSIKTAALVEKPDPDPVILLRRLDAQAYNPKSTYLDSETIHNVRQAGFDVLVWTVNDEKTMQKLIKDGVSGIITDFPQVLGRIIN
jgi:glycerophosphoryl diester phosphodiesterase